MSATRLRTALHYAAFFFTLAAGAAILLTGAGVLSETAAARWLGDLGWMLLLIVVGAGLVFVALHFLLVLADDRSSGVLYTRSGEWGRIDVSQTAVREFISGILRDELGVDRFRVSLERRDNGVAIRIRTTLAPDQRVPEVGERIQREIMRHVADRTGVEVREVSVFVRSIRARDSDAGQEARQDDLEV